MPKTDLKTRRAEILAKLSDGWRLIHRAGWPGKMPDLAYLQKDDKANVVISKVDYKWLVGSGYAKQVKYEYGGRTIYEITDAGRRRGEEK